MNFYFLKTDVYIVRFGSVLLPLLMNFLKVKHLCQYHRNESMRSYCLVKDRQLDTHGGQIDWSTEKRSLFLNVMSEGEEHPFWTPPRVFM